MAITPQALAALEVACLKDLKVSQSSASSTAGRLRIETETTTQILAALVTDGLAETDTIAHTITIYRLTPKGLELIS